MVVCKYFQQGFCRFGQFCRFEHSYASKYTYHAPAAQQSNITDEQLINQVHTDVQAALKGGQWILSAYAPFKEKPNLPGLTDLSPEEARLFIYEARANNTLDQAIRYIDNLTREGRSRYEQLLQTNPNLTKLFRALYKGETVPSPFENQQSNAFANSSTDASSIFRSAAQSNSFFGNQSNANPSIFGTQNSNSVFGQNTNAPEAKSIFAQANQSVFGGSQTQSNVNPSSLFGNAAQSAFGVQNAPFGQNAAPNIPANSQPNVFQNQEPFGQQNTKPADLFKQANSDNFFGQQPAQTANVFGPSPGSNIFAQTTSPGGSIFGQPAAGNVFEQNSADSVVYSNKEDLTDQELEAFNSNEFQLGFIPETAPCREVCF